MYIYFQGSTSSMCLTAHASGLLRTWRLLQTRQSLLPDSVGGSSGSAPLNLKTGASAFEWLCVVVTGAVSQVRSDKQSDKFVTIMCHKLIRNQRNVLRFATLRVNLPICHFFQHLVDDMWNNCTCSYWDTAFNSCSVIYDGLRERVSWLLIFFLLCFLGSN